MDARFFKSKEFAIAAVAAILLTGGAALALGGNLDPGSVRGEKGCSVPLPSGTAIEGTTDDTGTFREDGRVRRVVTFTYDTPVTGTVDLDACTRVGDLQVSPGDTDRVVVRFTISNHGPGAEQAVDELDVRSTVRQSSSGLAIAAWQATHTRGEGWFDSSSTQATLELELPAEATYRADLHTDVGDVTLATLSFRDLDLHTDVGDIESSGISVLGGLDARTDVGDVDMGVTSVSTGTWSLHTDVGDVDLALPSNEDTGYEIEATADVGGVGIEIGPTEHRSHDSDGPREEASARSEGYADKANQVTIEARTDVGSIDIQAT